MPKLTDHPRLRAHVRKGAGGKRLVYYYYDMRPDGEKDIPLGKDWDHAYREWDRIHNHAKQIVGTLLEAMEPWEEKVLPTYESDETRRGYTKHLRRLKLVFGSARWGDIDMPALRGYLAKRNGKTQANRELALLSVVWNWAILEGYTKLPYPAAGLKRSKWKNKERPRKFKVTDDLFDAVYAQGCQVVRDCMDLSTATGMRLTDCRTIPLNVSDDILAKAASKTGKDLAFDVFASSVLPGLIERRKALKAPHLYLLSTPTGRPVTYRMLNDRWVKARQAAAEKAEADGLHDFAARIRRMWLRDMRKRASDLAESDQEAADLLQHDDVRLTRKHYRSAVRTLKPVR